MSKRQVILKTEHGMFLIRSPNICSSFSRDEQKIKYCLFSTVSIQHPYTIHTGMVSENCRVAKVVPLFKKRSQDNPGISRPVSLTSLVGKLLEKILRNRIYLYLEDNGMIMGSRHGFINRGYYERWGF